jgi:hypothetical protein
VKDRRGEPSSVTHTLGHPDLFAVRKIFAGFLMMTFQEYSIQQGRADDGKKLKEMASL